MSQEEHILHKKIHARLVAKILQIFAFFLSKSRLQNFMICTSIASFQKLKIERFHSNHCASIELYQAFFKLFQYGGFPGKIIFDQHSVISDFKKENPS